MAATVAAAAAPLSSSSSFKSSSCSSPCSSPLSVQQDRLGQKQQQQQGSSDLGVSRFLTFYRLHLGYFIAVSAVGAALLRATQPATQLRAIDCVFNAVSTACTTGLTSVRMSSFTTAGDALLTLFMALGSTITTALIPLFIRRRRFAANICELHHLIERLGGAAAPGKPENADAVDRAPAAGPCAAAKAGAVDLSGLKQVGAVNTICAVDQVGAVDPVGDGVDRVGLESLPCILPAKPLICAGTVDPAVDLSHKSVDQCRLTAVAALEEMQLESEATGELTHLVSLYFLGWLVFGFLGIELFFLFSPAASAVVRAAGVNRAFFSLFTAMSAFTNAGILQLDDNMVPLNSHPLLLCFLALLILVGNTLFAPCLRAVISLLRRSSVHPKRRRLYDFLLRQPRRTFTHLFPRSETAWLVFTVMAFNAAESAAFYAFSWSSPSLAGMSLLKKLVNGFFQSITTRSAGLNVVAVGALPAPMLVLYILMMYIAVYPVYLTRQTSQAQDYDDKDKQQKQADQSSRRLWSQSKRLLARDSAFLFFSIFLVCILENKRIKSDPLNFSIFNIMFEVVSAYGNVGLSVGYDCSLFRRANAGSSQACTSVPYSLSGTWGVPGKLLMIVLMLLGRNRGLPDNMDMAVQLPKGFFTQVEERQQQQQQQDEDNAAAAAAAEEEDAVDAELKLLGEQRAASKKELLLGLQQHEMRQLLELQQQLLVMREQQQQHQEPEVKSSDNSSVHRQQERPPSDEDDNSMQPFDLEAAASQSLQQQQQEQHQEQQRQHQQQQRDPQKGIELEDERVMVVIDGGALKGTSSHQ